MKDLKEYIIKEMNDDEYDDNDFLDALLHYGELDHDTLVKLNGNKPVKINGKEVESIYWSTSGRTDYLVYADMAGYEKNFSLSMIPADLCDTIYDFLCDNEDPNRNY